MNVLEVEDPAAQPNAAAPQGQAPQQGVAQAPQPPVFALAPGLIGDAIINYASPEGSKLFKSATAPLETEFDLQPENLKVFLAQLKRRGEAHGWTEMFKVPPDLAKPDELQHIIDSYGTLTVEQVKAHAQTYVFGVNRVAQESYQLYNCIMASLTKTAQSKILLLEDEYYISNAARTQTRPSGATLLRIVIREAIVDTNATQRHLRELLSKLDQYATRVNGDIEKLNQHAQDVLNSLNARGATTQDLIPNLFKAYEAVQDKTFRAYILKKKDDYDEGNSFTPQRLMKLAENKYRMLVEDGLWQAPDEQAEKIIALEAQIKQLKKQKPKEKEQKSKKKTKNNKDGKDASRRQNMPAWKLVAPKQGEPHKKLIKGDDKPWYWCPKHEAWGRHQPQKCEGKGWVPQKFRKSNENKESKSDSKDSLTVAKAFQTIMEADEEDPNHV